MATDKYKIVLSGGKLHGCIWRRPFTGENMVQINQEAYDKTDQIRQTLEGDLEVWKFREEQKQDAD